MLKLMNKKFFGLIILFFCFFISSFPVFAMGYETIREPWIDAFMGIKHINNEYQKNFDRPLLVYPSVFKNGCSTIYENAYPVAGGITTYFCDKMYKVNYNGDTITDKKTAKDFIFSPSCEGQSQIEIPGFEGAFLYDELDEIIFYPNEWIWCDDKNLSFKKSNLYSEPPNDVIIYNKYGSYSYDEWAEYEYFVYTELEESIPINALCSYKFYNGVSTAYLDGKAGIIDENDNVIVPFEFDLILPVANKEGYTWILDDGKWGIIKISTNNITVTYNGNTIDFAQTPIIVDGHTLVPLRAIFEAFGASVKWDGESQKVISKLGDKTVSMTIGKNEIDVNGVKTTIDLAPKIVGDYTLIPVRSIAEVFGFDVTWDGSSNTVVICD